ncbi:MAG: HNH endonuclease [Nannocystaceae bacterium]
MIRISRGLEPPRLADLRADRLTSARQRLRAGEPIDFGGYAVVKPELFAMQRRKCCYCEKLEEQAKYRDVEHYRPKSRYWWLAWTWDNLLFSCFECNREHKQEQFPLAPGSTALVAEQAAPGAEHPLVIDPTDPTIEPTAEIEFRRNKVSGKERWVPYGLTARGRKTVEVCGLDRDGLLDLYVAHVNDVVRPKLVPLRAAHDSENARAVHEAWGTAKRALLGPSRPFRALSFDALRVLVPESMRSRYNLEIDRPRS